MNLLKFLETDCKNICLVMHKEPDGDAICSARAINLLYKKLFPEKKVFLLNDHNATIKLKFPKTSTDLPEFLTGDKIPPDSYLIYLDHTDFHYSLLHKEHWINKNIKHRLFIDHHYCYNSTISVDERLIDTSALSTCEIIYDLIKAAKSIEFDAELALALYLGIFSDTCYHQTPLTLKLLRKITELGSYCEHFIEEYQYYVKGHFYRSRKQLSYLWYNCVSKRNKDPLVTIYMTHNHWNIMKKSFLSLTSVITECLNLRTIDHVICVYEYAPETWGVLVRTNNKDILNKYVTKLKHPKSFTKLRLTVQQAHELKKDLKEKLRKEKFDTTDLQEIIKPFSDEDVL